jgi:hypothetical protein
VVNITQSENYQLLDKGRGLEEMLNETKLLNFAKLLKILIDLFGFDEPFQNIGDREGKEIEFFFPALNGYVTLVFAKNRANFEPRVGKSKNPVSKITINVKKKDIIRVVSGMITGKSNIFGVLKLFFKLVIPRKVKISGSYLSVVKMFKCMAIGKHKMYKAEGAVLNL